MTVPQEWTDAFHRLKFVFGEYCFYSVWFEAVEVATHVTGFEGCLDATAAAVTPLLRHHGAVAIPSHPISAAPLRLKITRDYLRYVPAATIHYFIEPGASPSEYLGRMPRKYRHELLRKQRRFTERSGGEVELRSYRTPGEAETFYPLACSVSRKTYQRNLLDVGLPETAAFEAELRAQAERDAVRGDLLFIGGTAVAYLTSSRHITPALPLPTAARCYWPGSASRSGSNAIFEHAQVCGRLDRCQKRERLGRSIARNRLWRVSG